MLVERDVIRATAAAQGMMSIMGARLSPDGIWSRHTQKAYDALPGSELARIDAVMSAAAGTSLTARDVMLFRETERKNGANMLERIHVSSSMSKDEVEQLITAVAKAEGVPPQVAIQFAKVESNLNVNAVSKTGASGLMQLTSGAIRQIGLPPPGGNKLDPLWNATVGIKYIKWVTRYLKIDFTQVGLIYAGYNVGVGTVEKLMKGQFLDPDVKKAISVQAPALQRGGPSQYLANATAFVKNATATV